MLIFTPYPFINDISKFKGYLFNNITFLILLCFMFNLFPTMAYTKQGQDKALSLALKAEFYSKQKGKELLALEYINQAIKLSPQTMDFYYKRAFIFGRAGIYPLAIKDFSLFINKREYGHAIRFRADCYMAMKKYAKASRDYYHFLKNVDPNDGKVWSFLAESLALAGNRQGALNAAQKGINTGSHWTERLRDIQQNIFANKTIIPHKPLSN